MYRFFKPASICIFGVVLLLGREIFSQTINISGKVTDTEGKALSGAVVKLKAAAMSATTIADGTFKITGTAIPIMAQDRIVTQAFSVRIQKGRIHMEIPKSSDVTISAFTARGEIFATTRYSLEEGAHDLNLTPGKAGINFYTIKSNDNEVTFKTIRVQEAVQGIFLHSTNGRLAKSSARMAYSDTLTVTMAGYKGSSMPITETTMAGIEIKLEKEASGDNGLFVHWKFDEAGASDVAVDASGNGWDGTPKTPMKRGEGKLGDHSLTLKCPEVMLTPEAMPFPTWPMTISAWVRPHVTAGRMYVITYLPNTSESHHEYEHLLFIEKGREVRFYMYGHAVKGGTKEKWGLVSPNALVANKWIHLAVTIGEAEAGATPKKPTAKEGAEATTWKLYENGEVTDEGVFFFPPFQAKGEWAIGAKPHGEYCMNGDIDELMVFNKELTGEEIKGLMTNIMP